jgi:prolyl oligopeptidase
MINSKLLLKFIILISITGVNLMSEDKFAYPETEKIPVREILHNVEFQDDYRWLEENENDKVKDWDKAQSDFSRDYLDRLPQREWLLQNYEKYGRYDSFGSINRLKNSDKIYQYKKKKNEEKHVLYIADNELSPMRVLIDPNQWPQDENLAYFVITEDGKLAVFGKTKGGNEAPVIYVMEVDSGKILPDQVKGWKQYITSWAPDNSGFYYVCNPLPGEVPAGEEFYWRTVYYHKLGTAREEDVKIFGDDEVKEKWSYARLTHDDKYLILTKGVFYKTAYWLKEPESDELTEIATDLDAEYNATYYKGKIYLLTNKDAPNWKVFVTDAKNPGKANWQEFIAESDSTITDFSVINNRIYVSYLINVQTKIMMYDLEGSFIQEVALPMPGTARIYGRAEGPDTWLWFTSFSYPVTIFLYDPEANSLKEFFKPPVNVDSDSIKTEQVWYRSKDSTKIPMFLVYKTGLEKDSSNPVILNGYGGFNVSMEPSFSLGFSFWIEYGGVLAIANLRGGGEFGEKWHEAGMKENKQNVFDDFIAAAEWLIAENYTSPQKLTVMGGSNGGLLVGAIVTQRPDLMKAALCQVPLLDMIRYHQSSIANIWKEEYGSAEDPEEFKYILKYSPYHNVKEATEFPAMLITTGINDARVDPFHARKFAALLQERNCSDNPIYLLVQSASGHGGGTTQSIQFAHWSDYYAFLMDQVGMKLE